MAPRWGNRCTVLFGAGLRVAAGLGGALVVLAVSAGPAGAICKSGDCRTDPPDKPLAPAVTHVSPMAGPSSGGTKVTVTLDNTLLDKTKAPPKVEFGTVAATNVTVTGTTTLIATSPPHSRGVVDVRVDAPYVGDDLPGGWTSSNSAAAWFTYCNGACSPPTITSITPSSEPSTGGELVTITGQGFAGGITIVSFGSIRASACSISDTQITALVPAAVNNQAGQVSVTVTDATGTSQGFPFTYTVDPLSGTRLDDNRNALTLGGITGLNSVLPSFLTSLLPGITGRVIANPAVHALFWDRTWDADNPLALSQSNIQAQLNALLGSSYLADAAQYGVGPATSTGGDTPSILCPIPSLHGLLSTITLIPWITCEAGGGALALTEVPGSGGIGGLPLPDGLPLADDNTDYAIFLPPQAGIGINGNRSCTDFDAFHALTVVSQLRFEWETFVPALVPVYQTVPFMVEPIDCAGGTAVSAVQILSHELVESATDPLIGLGWIKNSDFSLHDPFGVLHTGEASDICAGDNSQNKESVAGSVPVDTYWSNSRSACVPAAMPSCTSAHTALPISHPHPAVPVRGVRPLHQVVVDALAQRSAYRLTASMRGVSIGRFQPALLSNFTIVQEGRGRAMISGRAKVGRGPWTNFAIIQVGHRRCLRGAKGWVCRSGFPLLDTHPLVAALLGQRFSAPPVTTLRRSRVLTLAVQGDVSYTSGLVRNAAGLPTSVQSSSSIGKRTVAREGISFSYTPGAAIRLPG